MAAHPFLTPADYPSVRRLLDVQLSATELPDAVIADALFLGAAADEVLARDPDAESRTGAAEQAIKNATALLTAALIVPALAQIVGERFASYSASYALMQPSELMATLRARADAELRKATGSSRAAIKGFRLAKGRRGA